MTVFSWNTTVSIHSASEEAIRRGEAEAQLEALLFPFIPLPKKRLAVSDTSRFATFRVSIHSASEEAISRRIPPRLRRELGVSIHSASEEAISYWSSEMKKLTIFGVSIHSASEEAISPGNGIHLARAASFHSFRFRRSD